jgi:FkbH-like protein
MRVTLQDTLRRLTPNPASYLEAARELDRLEANGLRAVKMAIAASFTADLIGPYLRVEAARRGLSADVLFAPYGQLELQLLDPTSALHRAAPDVIIIATQLEDIAPALGGRLVSLSAQEIDAEVEAIEHRSADLVAGTRACSTATILMFNHALPLVAAAGLADTALPIPQSSVVSRVNDAIAGVCARTANCYVFDYARLVTEFGTARWTDPKLLYMARIPFSAAAQLELGRRLARYVKAIVGPPRKCLVVDLDNTLWGGVVGEDGVAGIKLGEDFPGNAFKGFQRYLAALRARGVLLAIASKNNEADVREVFERHPDCVLRLDDFAAREIHWRDKSSSLAAIARELNIGTDALVLFDDSAVECDWVRQQMPEVAVIQAPASPVEYIGALEKAEAFDHLVITAEDRQRAEQYKSEGQRRDAAARAGSVEDFLRSLEMVVTIGAVDDESIPRVTQLIAKTNQFNLTTRRHSAGQVAQMIAGGAVALWLRVADRYGDSGLVGVAIALEDSPRGWLIDTFLLSCRVIGRRVESALLAAVAKGIRARGGRTLLGQYVPTSKNSVASALYRDHGFEQLGDGLWRLLLDRGEPITPEFITVQGG